MDAAVNLLTTKAEIGFANHYERIKGSLPGADTDWVPQLRAEAFRAFAAAGLPHRRVEEFKYTDLRARLDDAYAPASALAEALSRDDVAATLGPGLATLDCYKVVFIDGRLCPDLSDLSFLGKRGGTVLPMGEALSLPPRWLRKRLAASDSRAHNAIFDLNTAMMSDGIILHVAAGFHVSKLIHIIHIHTATVPLGLTMRHVFRVDEGASVSVLESHTSCSKEPAQHNLASCASIGENATMHHIKVQQEGPQTTHISTWNVVLGAAANYQCFQFANGAQLARNQVFIGFAGEGARSDFNGIILGRGTQHLDTTLVVDHAVANCKASELFKGVFDDQARGVFQGKITVRPHAQKTDNTQMAKGLLLSEGAEFDCKPELEIFADDVICGHGATSGQIDEDLIFYLRARGIGEAEARSLLIEAFAGEALARIENEAIRAVLSDVVRGWLGERGA